MKSAIILAAILLGLMALFVSDTKPSYPEQMAFCDELNGITWQGYCYLPSEGY